MAGEAGRPLRTSCSWDRHITPDRRDCTPRKVARNSEQRLQHTFSTMHQNSRTWWCRLILNSWKYECATLRRRTERGMEDAQGYWPGRRNGSQCWADFFTTCLEIVETSRAPGSSTVFSRKSQRQAKLLVGKRGAHGRPVYATNVEDVLYSSHSGAPSSTPLR